MIKDKGWIRDGRLAIQIGAIIPSGHNGEFGERGEMGE